MATTLAAKPGFANGAFRFVSGAPRRWRATLLVAAGALVVAMAGPFGTYSIPFWPRIGFWLAVSLWNFAKWEAWFAILRRRGLHWRTILLLGLPALLLPLPLEVDLGLRTFAGTTATSYLGVLLRGAALAGLWALVVLLLPRSAMPPQARAARFPGTPIRCVEIAALVAEDHYVRLHLADGSSRLVLTRFGDAVAALAAEPGEHLNRGIWLADRFRGPAEHRDRRWYVRGAADLRLPVSRSRVAALRAIGWLNR